jgi:hypothetical protein
VYSARITKINYPFEIPYLFHSGASGDENPEDEDPSGDGDYDGSDPAHCMGPLSLETETHST